MKFQQLVVVAAAAAITFNFILVVSSDPRQLGLGLGLGLRGLKSFKEKGAVGTNITFDCSPSGPCVPCLYHEKKDVSYRCSETGYRIPMTCVKTAGEENKEHKDSPKEIYVTYRSCIPALTEENLSLLAFEALMLLLLVCSSFVIFRRKRSLVMPMPGPIRLPTTNPRF